MSDSNGQVGVLVTTQHRGVFFGFANSEDLERKDKIRLKRIRNCLYWHSSVGGFLGLAKTGPNANCKIGSEAPEAVVHDITSLTLCTPEAVTAWTSL